MGFGKDEELVVGSPNKSIFRYNSPLVQVCLIGLVCLCCPGMFNTLSGMGGGGQVDVTTANNANTALYTTFAIFDVLGGGIYNILGPLLHPLRRLLNLRPLRQLFLNHYQHQGFAIVAGAILGIGASLLQARPGAIMTSYPVLGRKGSHISVFWSIFNMGGVIGGLISFILNYNRSDVAPVNDDTYIGFMCFMSSGTVLTLAILHPNCVVWDDDSHYTNIKYSDVLTEAVEILKLFRNWKMLLMVPTAWAGTRPRPAPPQKHIWYGDGIPLTRLASGMGRG